MIIALLELLGFVLPTLSVLIFVAGFWAGNEAKDSWMLVAGVLFFIGGNIRILLPAYLFAGYRRGFFLILACGFNYSFVYALY